MLIFPLKKEWFEKIKSGDADNPEDYGLIF